MHTNQGSLSNNAPMAKMLHHGCCLALRESQRERVQRICVNHCGVAALYFNCYIHGCYCTVFSAMILCIVTKFLVPTHLFFSHELDPSLLEWSCEMAV